MASPRVPLAPSRRAFQLQTADAVCRQKTRRPSSRVPSSVQGGGLPSFFLYRKKKDAKPLRAKSRRYAAVALRDAAAAAEMLPPEKCFARSRPKSQPCGLVGLETRLRAQCDGRPGGAAFVPRSPNGPLRVPSGTRASPGL